MSASLETLASMNGTPSYFRDKTVLVTRASPGIGQELARHSEYGAKLTVAARRQETLESLSDRIAKAGRPEAARLDLRRDPRRRRRAGGDRIGVAAGHAGRGRRQRGFGVVGGSARRATSS